MSNKQILDYFETDLATYNLRGVEPVTCVQTAGDVVIIPESWGHGVLNIQESVAIATEARQHVYRVKPSTSIYKFLPSFDNKLGK
jgi:oxalate decarboxylase/phosphoglucose isomerase-like protein (cupin superfamily)